MARILILSIVVVLGTVSVATQTLPPRLGEWLCDPQFENCQTDLINLIKNEQQGIDIAFWYMTDFRYRDPLLAAKKRGVTIRVLIDEDNARKSGHDQTNLINDLRLAGIPIRTKFVDGDILHFKMMLFHGLNMVQFSKANYEPSAFFPLTPNVDYHDEAIFYTNDINITDSFRYAFDDVWTNTTVFTNYANVTEDPLLRQYPWVISTHASMNFPPKQDFVNRLVGRFNAETQGIDAHAFRITDNRASDAIIAARQRGVRVRLFVDSREYRLSKSIWHAKHIDKFWDAGVEIKEQAHAGYMHEGAVVLRGLGEVVFGSSNWTIASANRQNEHNFFFTSLSKPVLFQWFADQFDRKWSDTANYRDFKPLAPQPKPVNYSPQNVASGVGTSVTLTWEGGEWAHFYDIYLGTTPTPPRIVLEKLINPGDNGGTRETHTVTNLLPGTTYYWRIVSKTWAAIENNGGKRCDTCSAIGPLWSFTTAGAPPPASTGAPIPGIVQAEDFDPGGQNVAYNDTTSANSGNVYRKTEGVDIGPTSDPLSNGYYVGWTRVGEWMKYTINATEARSYTLNVHVANVGTGAKFRVEVDGNLLAEQPLPNTGGWDVWQDVALPSFSLTQGTHVVRLVMFTANTGASGVGNYGYLRFD